jgi:hypothetical protein
MISPTAHRSASVVFGHGLLPGLRPVRLRFGYAAERGRVDRKRIQDKDCFVITTRPPKRGRSIDSGQCGPLSCKVRLCECGSTEAAVVAHANLAARYLLRFDLS